jgi:hypothetical protein
MMSEADIFKLAISWTRDYLLQQAQKGRTMDVIPNTELHKAAAEFVKDYEIEVIS